MFVTDMHFLDIQPPAQLLPGLAGISGSGVSGTSANFYAFMPLPFLQSFGLTETTVDQVQGYVDGIPVPTGDFENLGLRSDLGFGFNDAANPNNTVLKVHVRNGSWSTRTVQFGRLDQTGPVLAVTSKRTTKKSPAKVQGTVSDTSGVASVQYSLKKASGPYKNAKLSGGTWSFKLPIKNGKSAKAFVRATDILGNVSQPITAKVVLK